MEPKQYDWKITARKAGAWALATFIAGAVGSIEGGVLRPKAVISAGILSLAVGLGQALRNYQKNKPQLPATVPANPPEVPQRPQG